MGLLQTIQRGAKRLKDQLDPFDGGKTWQNPRPQARPQANPYSRNQYNGAAGGGNLQVAPVRNPALDIKPAPEIQIPSQPLQVTTAKTPELSLDNKKIEVSPDARTAPTGLIKQAQKARADFRMPQDPVSSALQSVGRDFIARPGAEIAALATGKKEIKATNPVTRLALGDEPVKSPVETARGTYRDVKSGGATLPGGIPIPQNLAPYYAAANVAVHAGYDLPVAGGVIKGGSKVAKPVIKKAGSIKLPQQTPLGQEGKIQLPFGPKSDFHYSSSNGSTTVSGKANKVRAHFKPLNEAGFAKAPGNPFQDTLQSGKRPSGIKEIVNQGGNPLYHDTSAKGVLGILNDGEIKTSQAPFSQIAGQGKRVSTTRNFDNYSRYGKSPYRFIIDESKTNQRALPDNREEFESIFKKNVSTKAVHSLGIDVTNPALISDINSGKLAEVIQAAKAKGIKIEPFDGKILPDEYSNREVQSLTKNRFNEVFNPSKPKLGLKKLNEVGAVGKVDPEAIQYAHTFNITPEEAVKQLAELKKAEAVAAGKQIRKPEGVGVPQGVKEQLQPKVPFKRTAQENTQLNPVKIELPKTQPGDYQMARALPNAIANPIKIRANIAIDAAKKLSPEEQAQIPHLVEGTVPAVSKEAKAFVKAHNDLTNHTHAVSQALGGNTNFVPNYYRHAVDLSNPADAARWEELVAKRGGQAADPYSFGGIDNMNRVFNSTKELEDAGFHLKNPNDPVQNIIDYGQSSANTLRKQAMIKGITEADMNAPLKNRNFDLGDGRVVPVSQDALKEIRSLAIHDPSKNKAVVGARTANAGLKSSILSYGQFHPFNISVLRAGPSIAMAGHPINAVKGVAGTFRPLLPGGKGAVGKMYEKAIADKVVDPVTKQAISYADAAAQIGAPYGARGYEVAGTKLKSGAGHKLVFERQMPMMHNQVIRSVVDDLVKKGVSLSSPEARQAGIAANSTMGFINKEVLNISPKAWQAMNDVMLANQFTPSKIVTLSKVHKGGTAGKYARSDVASNVLSAAALISGVGYLVNQKSDSVRDALLRALVNPAVPTPWKDKKGNNVELRIPLTYTGEISHLLGIKLHRQDDGHLGVTWHPTDAAQTIPEWAKARLSPLLSTGVKIATNKNFADKPLYDETAPAGTKVIQAGTTIGQGFLPIGLQGLPNTKIVKDHLPQTARDILDNNTPGSNPLVKSGLGSLGFSPRTDQTVGKAAATRDYFDKKEQFAKTLNPDEKAIFDKVAAPSKDSFGNKVKPTGNLVKVADYGDLVANPEFANKYQRYQQSQKNHDPLWDLSPQQLRSYMQAQVISKNDPGGDSDTVRKLYARLPDGFFSERDKYFEQLKKSGAKFDESKYNSKPGMPDNLVAFSNNYHNLPYGTGARSAALRSPEGQAYIAWLDQNRIYNNQERADLGLPPLEDPNNKYGSSGGSGSFSKYAKSGGRGNKFSASEVSNPYSNIIKTVGALNKKVGSSKIKAAPLKSKVKKPGSRKK